MQVVSKHATTHEVPTIASVKKDSKLLLINILVKVFVTSNSFFVGLNDFLETEEKERQPYISSC